MKPFLFLIILTACQTNPGDSRLTPFQIPIWKAFPNEQEIIDAVVGSNGSMEERADAEMIARDLLLPRLLEETRGNQEALRWELESLERSYQNERTYKLGQEFLRLALWLEMSDLASKATRLASVRLKHALWPDEAYDPFPDEWKAQKRASPASVPVLAIALQIRMAELDARYHQRLPVVFSDARLPLTNREFGQHRCVLLARNSIYVAMTGDYRETNGWIWELLSARGIATVRMPEDRPY